MSWHNKVVWSEGLFLRPQHFQQQDRYVEHLVDGRCTPLRSFPWGFTHLKLDSQLLAVGKLSISEAAGIFPDGTPFDIPNDTESPPPMDVSDDMRDQVVYLAVPTRRPGTLEIAARGNEEGLARYIPSEYDVRDSTTGTVNTASMQVGGLRTKFLLESDQRGEYACLGVAHLVEKRADNNVVLHEEFIPSVMDAQATTRLAGFLNELQGLLHHRGEALAGRVSETGRGGAAEIADFLLLQAVNRYEPLVTHMAQLGMLHPELLYQLFVSIAGELSTFTSSKKRPPTFATYRHDDLRKTFAPVMAALRESLSMVLEQNAIPLPLKERQFGIRVAKIADRSILTGSSFVLAVQSDLPVENVRQRFPNQIKIGPVEKIRELVNLQLPGILLRPLPVAPRQIPYHAGFVYFELDQSGDYWRMLKDSGGFAMHVGGEFPGLQLEFWAIRG